MTKATVTKLREPSETKFRVESGVPIPPVVKSYPKYPFDQMQVGDSFDAGEHSKADKVRVRNAAAMHGRRTGTKFTTRKTDDNRIRCWRVA